jgi:hypothetical protein
MAGRLRDMEVIMDGYYYRPKLITLNYNSFPLGEETRKKA